MASHLSSIIDSVDSAVWEFFVNRPFLTGLADVVTDVGLFGVLLPVSVVLAVVVLRTTKSGALSLQVPITVYVSAVAISWMKEWSAVARPPREFWLEVAESDSFPSGHSGNTAAFLTACVLVLRHISPRHQRLAVRCALGAWCVMAWTRLALNVHWLSDVVAGGAVGVVVAFVIERIIDGSRVRRASQLQTRG